MVLSGINTVLFAYLLIVYVRTKSNLTCLSIMTKVKTSVLILLFIFELIVFLRYTFELYQNERRLYDTLLLTSQFLQAIIYLYICYFFTKKAAHFVEESKKLRKLMLIGIYISIACLVTLTIYQIVEKPRYENDLCHSSFFIVADVLNQLACGFFTYMGCRVFKSVKQFNRHQKALIDS